MNVFYSQRAAVYSGLERYYNRFVDQALIVDAADLRNACQPDYEANIAKMHQRIPQLLTDNTINCVVLDVALETLSVKDPAVQQFYRDFQSLADVRIITGEFETWQSRRARHRYYSPPEQYRWFLPFFHIYRCRYQSAPPLMPDTRSRGIMCLNNNMNFFRLIMYLMLHRYNLADKIAYSQRSVDLDQDCIMHLGEKYRPQGPHWVTARTRCLADDTMFNHEWLNTSLYQDAAVNLVVEVCVHDAARIFACCVSEKCVKPFAAGQIPIIFGAAGINGYLEHLGFDMFADVVPWRTWDGITDPTRRAERLVSWLAEWHEHQDLSQLYQQHAHRCRSNQQYLFSDQFADVLYQDLSIRS